MANAIIEIPDLPTGLELTAALVNKSTDALVESGEDLTERTNAKTRYRYTHTGGATGWHIVVVSLGATPIGSWEVNLENADGVYEATDDSLLTAEDVWTNYSRTLTMTPEQLAAALAESGEINIHRGDKNSFTFTNLGSIADRTKLWFTMKRDKRQLDTAAMIQVEEADGLLVLNGAEPDDVGDVSLVVDDEDLGVVTLTVYSGASAPLSPIKGAHYDLQVLRSGDDEPETLVEDLANVTADVTRRTA